jgi:hypothetical protein
MLGKNMLRHDSSSALLPHVFFFSANSTPSQSSKAGESHEVGKPYTHPVGHSIPCSQSRDYGTFLCFRSLLRGCLASILDLFQQTVNIRLIRVKTGNTRTQDVLLLAQYDF